MDHRTDCLDGNNLTEIVSYDILPARDGICIRTIHINFVSMQKVKEMLLF